VILVGVFEVREQWRALVTTVVNLSTGVWPTSVVPLCVLQRKLAKMNVLTLALSYSINARNESGASSVNDVQCYGIISTLLQSILYALLVRVGN
jgi:hypothetical protein